jgi:distribution and morphology protein 32
MQNSDYAVVNVKIKLKDLKATLPKYMPMATSTSAPFISLHDLRSLVAFANELGSSSPPIVVQSTAIERLSDLHNTENIFDTRLFDLIVNDVYEELLKMVHLDEKRIIEEKSSLWSHSVASQLLVLGLSAMV